jgi:hypothetical protein
MFVAMAVAAWALTGTQAVLAVQIARHVERTTCTLSVEIGLWFTFILGSISGMLLGSMQAPLGSGLPVLGWHMWGDIRPAHFLGIHAHQLLPLLGWQLRAKDTGRRRDAIALVAITYVLAWVALVALGLSRRV